MRSSIFAQICCVFSLIFCTVSYAVERHIPANAKTGTIAVSDNRALMIDDKVIHLTAAAQIRDTRNMLIQPQTLKNQLGGRLAGYEVPILYTENNQGHVHRIWILTKDELDKHPLDEEEEEETNLPNRSARPSGTIVPNRDATPSVNPVLNRSANR